MLLNFMKLALRNFIRNRLFTVISVSGLSLAVGCFILPFLFIDLSNKFDAFHDNKEKIYYIEILIERNGNTQLWGPTPVPLGPALKADFPQIEDYVRIRPREGVFKYEHKVFKESFLFVDEAFLTVFTFPTILGDRQALRDRNAIVISETSAEKYFGSEDPIGKKITVSNGNEFQQDFIVTAVVAKHPPTSSIQFDILLPYDRLKDWENSDFNDWGIWTHTFIQIKNQADLDIIKTGMDTYIQLQNEANESWLVSKFIFEPLDSMSKNTDKVNNDLGIGFPISAKVGLSLLGMFILALACFNYINIGIVTASRRLKEIGIRKVMGSSRLKLIFQFLIENIILCLLAVIIGVLIAHYYIIPSFNRLFESPLEMDFLHNYRLWLFLIITFVVTSLGAGGYPAFYISRFHPSAILRKIQSVGGGIKFTKLFLMMQFIVTFIMIGTALIFIQNTEYHKNIDWGYNQEQVISMPIIGEKQFEVYKNAILQNPFILNVSGSQDHIGRSSDIDVVEYRGKEYEICRFAVGYDYMDVLQLKLIKGRGFDRQFSTDIDQSIVVNEMFVSSMNWEKPVGQFVIIEDKKFNVIGVVEDFYYRPFIDPVEPTLLRLCYEEDFEYFSVRVKAGYSVQAAKFLEDSWKRLFPDDSYDGFFQDSVWEWFFRENLAINKVAGFAAFVALVISCMGLFGLISVTVVKRTKEVTIRKVLGASNIHIVKLLNKEMLWILLLSSIFAMPLCYCFMNWYLDLSYATRVPIRMISFLFVVIIIISTSLLTVLTQIIKATKAKIIDNLRIE